MKKLLLLFLILLSIGVKAQYHIRVECDDEIMRPPQYYTITYTTNNWLGLAYLQEIKTKDEFFTDNSDDHRSYKDVYLFQFYSPNKNRLIEIAKHFKTYQDIVNYNKNLTANYLKQKAYYLSIRPKITPFVPKPLAKKECCKLTQVY